jgi:hypothetical protein
MNNEFKRIRKKEAGKSKGKVKVFQHRAMKAYGGAEV